MTNMVPLVLATLIFQQSPPNQTSAPSPAYYREGPGVTSPILIRETKPNYTAAAMRARIHGVVRLECVVMPDGSVGKVQVVRSLDVQFGLDQEAMNAVRQWRFRPGMKDGAPVPVLVFVEMSFTLKDRPDDAAPNTAPAAPLASTRDAEATLAWPDAFGNTGGPVSPSTAFSNGALHHPTFDVAFSYPSAWSTVESSAGITLYSEDASGTRAVMISSPQAAQFSFTEPVSQSVLDSFTVSARAGAAFITNPRLIKSGQVPRDGGLWIWFEMEAPSFAAWNAPPALADRLRSGYGGIHVWSFVTTAAGQSISVFCTVVHRTGLSDADQQQQIRQAGIEFNEILSRISIQPR